MVLEIGLKIIVLACLIFASAFFSSSETAFISMNRVKIKRLVDAGVPGAAQLHRLKEKAQKTLVTILIANDLFQFAAGSVTASITFDLLPGELGIAVSTGAITFLILVFSDITPKTLALKYAEPIALRSAPILHLLLVILAPVIFVLESISLLLLRSIGAVEGDQKLTEEEVKIAAVISAEEGAILAEERDMIHKIFLLNDITVRQVMTPRENVIAFAKGTFVKEIGSELLKEHQRFPVYGKSIDDIVGVFYARDYLGKAMGTGGKVRVESIMRHPIFVHSEKKLDYLLKIFKSRHSNIAIVVNSSGLTIGVVTVEDVVAEIVGEIREK